MISLGLNAHHGRRRELKKHWQNIGESTVAQFASVSAGGGLGDMRVNVSALPSNAKVFAIS